MKITDEMVHVACDVANGDLGTQDAKRVISAVAPLIRAAVLADGRALDTFAMRERVCDDVAHRMGLPTKGVISEAVHRTIVEVEPLIRAAARDAVLAEVEQWIKAKGLKVVPVQPTTDMWEHGGEMMVTVCPIGGFVLDEFGDYVEEIFKKMVAAAPAVKLLEDDHESP